MLRTSGDGAERAAPASPNVPNSCVKAPGWFSVGAGAAGKGAPAAGVRADSTVELAIGAARNNSVKPPEEGADDDGGGGGTVLAT